MSIVKNQLNELIKMNEFTQNNGELLDPEEKKELDAFITCQIRQCELYCKLEDLVEKQKKAESKPETTTEEREEPKAKPKRRTTKKKVEEPIKKAPQTTEPAKGQPDLFDDLDDLLG